MADIDNLIGLMDKQQPVDLALIALAAIKALNDKGCGGDNKSVEALYAIAREATDFTVKLALSKPELLRPLASRYPTFPAMIHKTSGKDGEHGRIIAMMELGKHPEAILNADTSKALEADTPAKQWAHAIRHQLTMRKRHLASLVQNQGHTPNARDRDILGLPPFNRRNSRKWFELAKQHIIPPNIEKDPEWRVATGKELHSPSDIRHAIHKEIQKALHTIAPDG